MWRSFLPQVAGDKQSHLNESHADKALLVAASVPELTHKFAAPAAENLSRSSPSPLFKATRHGYVFHAMEGLAAANGTFFDASLGLSSVQPRKEGEAITTDKSMVGGSISSISEDDASVASAEDEAFVGMAKMATEFETGNVLEAAGANHSPQVEPSLDFAEHNNHHNPASEYVMADPTLWRSATTAGGRVYFYHTLQRVSMWSLPATVDPSRVKHKGATPLASAATSAAHFAAPAASSRSAAEAEAPPLGAAHPPSDQPRPEAVARNLAMELTAALSRVSSPAVAFTTSSTTAASFPTAPTPPATVPAATARRPSPADKLQQHANTALLEQLPPTAAQPSAPDLGNALGARQQHHQAEHSAEKENTPTGANKHTPDPAPTSRFKPLPKRSAALRDKFRRMVRQGGVSSPAAAHAHSHSPHTDPMHLSAAASQAALHVPAVSVPGRSVSPSLLSTSPPGTGPSGSRWVNALAAEDAARVPCSDCGRHFLPAALAVHARVCARVFGNTPPQFDAAKARLRDTPAARFNEKPKPCERCGKRFGHASDLKYHLQLCKGVKGGRGTHNTGVLRTAAASTSIRGGASASNSRALTHPATNRSASPAAAAAAGGAGGAGGAASSGKPFGRTAQRLSARAANKAKWVFRSKNTPGAARDASNHAASPPHQQKALLHTRDSPPPGQQKALLHTRDSPPATELVSESSAEDESIDFFVPTHQNGTSPTAPSPIASASGPALAAARNTGSRGLPEGSTHPGSDHQSSNRSSHGSDGVSASMSFLGADVFASVEAFGQQLSSASAAQEVSVAVGGGQAHAASAPPLYRAEADESALVEASSIASVPPSVRVEGGAGHSAPLDTDTVTAAVPPPTVAPQGGASQHLDGGGGGAPHPPSIAPVSQEERSAEAGVGDLSDMSADASAIVNEAPVACGSCGEHFHGAAKLCAHLTSCGSWRHQRNGNTEHTAASSVHSGGQVGTREEHTGGKHAQHAWTDSFPASRVHHTDDAPVVPSEACAISAMLPPFTAPASPSFDAARVPCPHCQRRFAPEIAEHHVFVCSKVTHRPSPPRAASLPRSSAAAPAPDASPAPPPKAAARRAVTPPRPSTALSQCTGSAQRSVSAHRTSPGMDRLRSRGAYSSSGGGGGATAAGSVAWCPATPAPTSGSGRPPTSSGRGLHDTVGDTPGSYYLPTPFDRFAGDSPDRVGASFAAHEAAAELVFSPSK